MYVTQEQLHKELGDVESRLTEKIERLEGTTSCLQTSINDVQSELRDFKVDIRSDMRVALAEQEQRFDQKFTDWLSVIRTDIENFKIVIIEEMEKKLQLQRFYFQQDMEIIMKKQREEFNADTGQLLVKSTNGDFLLWAKR
jgi:hypothetical protein